jgi:hypothetical protein
MRVREYIYRKGRSAAGLPLGDGTLDEAHIITDPYRPAIGTTPSDDAPLVVKTGEELPAGRGMLGW